MGGAGKSRAGGGEGFFVYGGAAAIAALLTSVSLKFYQPGGSAYEAEEGITKG